MLVASTVRNTAAGMMTAVLLQPMLEAPWGIALLLPVRAEEPALTIIQLNRMPVDGAVFRPRAVTVNQPLTLLIILSPGKCTLPVINVASTVSRMELFG